MAPGCGTIGFHKTFRSSGNDCICLGRSLLHQMRRSAWADSKGSPLELSERDSGRRVNPQGGIPRILTRNWPGLGPDLYIDVSYSAKTGQGNKVDSWEAGGSARRRVHGKESAEVSKGVQGEGGIGGGTWGGIVFLITYLF